MRSSLLARSAWMRLVKHRHPSDFRDAIPAHRQTRDTRPCRREYFRADTAAVPQESGVPPTGNAPAVGIAGRVCSKLECRKPASITRIGPMNRYPLPTTVSRKRGFAWLSPSAVLIFRMTLLMLASVSTKRSERQSFVIMSWRETSCSLRARRKINSSIGFFSSFTRRPWRRSSNRPRSNSNSPTSRFAPNIELSRAHYPLRLNSL